MKKILVINSSVRTEKSNSRQLVAKVVDHLQGQFEASDIIYRDVAADPIPHFDVHAFEGFAGGDSKQSQAAVNLSDSLVDELMSSDAIVIGSPVYNFSIPTTLKAWIDNITRVGVTFRYSEKGPEGLVKGKKVYVVTARGGGKVEHIEEQLKTTFAMMGMTDVTFLHAANLDTPNREEGLAVIHARIKGL